MNRNKATRNINKLKTNSEGLFCNYSNRICMKQRLEGYEFCIRHILEDKTAPFKQCCFVPGKKGDRCQNATPKGDRKDGLCLEHARRANIVRQKQLARHQPEETAESLLAELAQSSSPSIETLKDLRQKSRLPVDSIANKVLEYASSEESDVEACLVDGAWRGDGDSDAESIDSEQEDILKHAGVYTAEEMTLILRDKLIRLQSLYIEQFKRLQHVMKEHRRRYLHTHKQERDTLGSLKAYKADPHLRKKYDKLKAYKRYHNRYGKEAILHYKSKQRRQAISEAAGYKPQTFTKCQGEESGVRCSERSVPLSKYCMKHILLDPNQVLFQPCTFANSECGIPVAAVDDEPRCPIHYSIIDSVQPPTSSTVTDMVTVDMGDHVETSTDSTLSAPGEQERRDILMSDISSPLPLPLNVMDTS